MEPCIDTLKNNFGQDLDSLYVHLHNVSLIAEKLRDSCYEMKRLYDMFFDALLEHDSIPQSLLLGADLLKKGMEEKATLQMSSSEMRTFVKCYEYIVMITESENLYGKKVERLKEALELIENGEL